MSLMSQAEYARLRRARGLTGGSANSVSTALRIGRIKSANGLIDSGQADRDWIANTNRNKQRHPKVESELIDESMSEAQTRKEIALANLRELEEAEKRGLMIEAEDVRKAWSGHIAAVKNTLLLMPPRVAPKLASASGVHEIQAVLDRELRALLVEFSDAA